ncbi:hypothetical protein RJ640_005846 [Escallonia rubra]|uniref:Uncharacterized protein n=1 Tax=Escallonia rubra TaxID=112253 RepID=A0AA88UCB9_9ASTE|nr:hypothetical protein RJ640_005846 [Escallonia rubra]
MTFGFVGGLCGGGEGEVGQLKGRRRYDGSIEGERWANLMVLRRHRSTAASRRIYSTSLNLANECTYNVWSAVVSGHGTPPLTTTIFMLEPGELASLLIPPSWSGQLWARTLCSYGLTGRFNCLTGDYGTGSEECASAQTVPPVTVAKGGKQQTA